MHYAVPALLARAGMLQRFYTDVCADVGLLPRLARLLPPAVRPSAVKRLLGRRVPAEIDRRAIRDCGAGQLLASLAGRGRAVDDCLIDLMRRDRFGGANALYTVLVNSDLDLVREARAQGIKVAHEVMISPDVGLWLREERDRFPGLEPQDSAEEIDGGRARDAEKYGLVDRILVPSQFVRDAVLALGASAERVVTVPYGVDSSWLDAVPRPQPGRLLFVGSVGLRKGVHYLAEATRLRRDRGVAVDVRVVGPVSPDLIRNPLFAGPTYVGRVLRDEVRQEFLAADVFVLPSIGEGSATVTYEALACGLPVVTTPNAGSVVRDGVDGFVVPVRDSAALADRIEQVVTDRALRHRLSQDARARASEFTWERYGDRLIAALQTLGGVP
jgi:glycosyltransferase involved in cell wall biosynthesis